MTEYEVQLAILETSGAVSDQFQFWMAATFAVVVASYTAGKTLPLIMRYSIALVYIVAVIMFYLRYLDSIDQMNYYAMLLEQMESGIPVRRIGSVGFLRKTLMLGGSLLALAFIFLPTWNTDQSDDKNEI